MNKLKSFLNWNLFSFDFKLSLPDVYDNISDISLDDFCLDCVFKIAFLEKWILNEIEDKTNAMVLLDKGLTIGGLFVLCFKTCLLLYGVYILTDVNILGLGNPMAILIPSFTSFLILISDMILNLLDNLRNI